MLLTYIRHRRCRNVCWRASSHDISESELLGVDSIRRGLLARSSCREVSTVSFFLSTNHSHWLPPPTWDCTDVGGCYVNMLPVLRDAYFVITFFHMYQRCRSLKTDECFFYDGRILLERNMYHMPILTPSINHMFKSSCGSITTVKLRRVL